jgi:hypothetical protein
MREIVEKNNPLQKVFLSGFVGGIGWSLGITVGFSILVFIITQILSILGGLPLVGMWIADVVKATEEALRQSR